MAYIRQAGQAVQVPGYQTGGGMLGGSPTSSIAQPTDAGKPGGWTNIQDYLNANRGDRTNINTAKTQTAGKIQEGAKSIQEQKENVSPLPQAVQYSAEATNQALDKDDYGVFSQGLSQQPAVDQMRLIPTAEQEIYGNAPLESRVNEITNLDPTNFNKTMQFVGGLSDAPGYSTGMKAFDAMLLQGSPEFRQGFVPQVQEQYKTLYQQPLEQARQERTGQISDAQKAIEAAQSGWKEGISDWLGTEDQAIADILAQQQAQEAQEADLTFQEWLPLYQAYLQANPPSDPAAPVGAPAYLAPGYDYKQHAERTGNVAPDINTAAYQYGPDKLADYNALAELLSQYGGSYNQYTPAQGYNPGQWTYKP